jgi:transcriptional regulator with XRE-family HTH domain
MAKTRTDAICELRRAGWKYAEIATVIGLSVSRVNQLLSDSGLQRKRRRKVPENVVNAVLTKPADEPYSSVAERVGISRNAAIGIAYRAKKAEKVETPAPDLTLKSPKSRRAAEIRAKYLQWAREAEVA